ncbi:hypothetical protein QF026_001460 [Streptomyces aurantiacus]|uniref:hypothetical protein n=1 Tax=Streptomyces aurantiacus TaxID=47760 RepID=UPI002790736A|nr:hypothetical protein [Streptomyces aurantiacus]MDQ0772994.1 hypothetical protein [Streptomyces aurantiacus]
MSDTPQISAALAYVEARERELDKEAGQLRSRIEDLTAHLGGIDAESENPRTTRKTLLAIPRPDPVQETPRPDVPDHPAYQQILTALTDAAGRCGPATCARHSTCRSSRKTPKASGPS